MLDTNVPSSKLDEQITRQAAQNLGIAYVPYYATNRADLDRALAEMEERRPDALVLGGGSGLFTALQQGIIDKATRLGIPMSLPGRPAQERRY
jgi:riboflavin biosynthesis pyrimidine reductase